MRAESIESNGLNSTFSNDFNALLFGDAFTYDINEETVAEGNATNEESKYDITSQEREEATDILTETTSATTQQDAEGAENSKVDQGETANKEEATFIQGVAFNIDTSSVICSAGNLATHGDEYESNLNQIEQVIEFGYDLTMNARSDVATVLADFESTLLSYIGSKLESSGCVLGRRQLQRRATQDVVLKKISSLPDDVLNDRGKLHYCTCRLSLVDMCDRLFY